MDETVPLLGYKGTGGRKRKRPGRDKESRMKDISSESSSDSDSSSENEKYQLVKRSKSKKSAKKESLKKRSNKGKKQKRSRARYSSESSSCSELKQSRRKEKNTQAPSSKHTTNKKKSNKAKISIDRRMYERFSSPETPKRSHDIEVIQKGGSQPKSGDSKSERPQIIAEVQTVAETSTSFQKKELGDLGNERVDHDAWVEDSREGLDHSLDKQSTETSKERTSFSDIEEVEKDPRDSQPKPGDSESERPQNVPETGTSFQTEEIYSKDIQPSRIKVSILRKFFEKKIAAEEKQKVSPDSESENVAQHALVDVPIKFLDESVDKQNQEVSKATSFSESENVAQHALVDVPIKLLDESVDKQNQEVSKDTSFSEKEPYSGISKDKETVNKAKKNLAKGSSCFKNLAKKYGKIIGIPEKDKQGTSISSSDTSISDSSTSSSSSSESSSRSSSASKGRSSSSSSSSSGKHHHSRSLKNKDTSRRRSRSPLPTRHQSPPRPKKLHVGKLTKNVSKEALEEIFNLYGKVTNVDLPIDRTNGSSRGFAYIEYATASEAEEAVKCFNGAQLDGQKVSVVPVLPFKPRPIPVRRSPNRRPFQNWRYPQAYRSRGINFGGRDKRRRPLRSPPPQRRRSPRRRTRSRSPHRRHGGRRRSSTSTH